jgi:hypothetical protein
LLVLQAQLHSHFIDSTHQTPGPLLQQVTTQARPSAKQDTSTSSRIYAFLKNTWNMFQAKSYLGHRKSPKKFKKIEIISTVFSDHNDIKPEIINRRNIRKFTNTWKF